MRGLLRLWIALLLFVGAVGLSPAPPARGEDACVLCAGAKSIACPTCAGKGVAAFQCDACGGDAKAHCPNRVRALSPEFGPRNRSPEHVGSDRLCPNVFCVKGVVKALDDKSLPCKACGGAGTVKCGGCAGPCSACEGRGAVTGPCPDCNGAGKLVCLLCATPGGQCAQCGDKNKSACVVCKGVGKCVQVCRYCAGRGRIPCDWCGARDLEPCVNCFGTGIPVIVDLTARAASKKCSSCDGRGTARCTWCRGGWTQCVVCKGSRRVEAPCRRCDGASSVACRLCGESAFYGLAIEARRIALAGRKEPAIAMLTRALALAKRAAAKSAEVDDGNSAAPPTDGATTKDPNEMTLPEMLATSWLTAARKNDLVDRRAALESVVYRIESEIVVLKIPASPPPGPK